jgi:hypothetical protein
MKPNKYYILFLLSFFSFISSYSQNNPPSITKLSFGEITINDSVYIKDVVIEQNKIRKRKKSPSKHLKSKYSHTPLSIYENIPWDCDTLIIGTGMSGKLPITPNLKREAKKRGVKLIMLKTPKAIEYYSKHYSNRTNAIFHTTC